LPISELQPPGAAVLAATVMDGIVYSGWMLFFNFYIWSAASAGNIWDC
jgi:hypothetical protein